MNPHPPTHGELVLRAEMWLRQEKKCRIAFRELRSAHTPEQPDAIGWNVNGTSILVECKTSISDFNRDAVKRWRQHPETGVGRRRFYMFPPGIFNRDRDGIPMSWGVVICNPKTVSVVKDSDLHEMNWKAEIGILSTHANDSGLWQEFLDWKESQDRHD